MQGSGAKQYCNGSRGEETEEAAMDPHKHKN